MLMQEVMPALYPFDQYLNDVVIEMADRFVADYVVSSNAPSNYKELRNHLDAGNTMVVFEEGSQNTIFADPKVNWAFRAWHDWCHWKGEFDFTLYGEQQALNMQLEHIAIHHSHTDQTEYWKRSFAPKSSGNGNTTISSELISKTNAVLFLRTCKTNTKRSNTYGKIIKDEP